MPSDDGFDGLSRIGQVSVPVRDVKRATAFYRDRLGLKFLFEAPRMAFFDCDGVRLLLGLPEGEAAGPPGSILCFTVGDIAQATEALRRRQVTITGDPHPTARMPDHELWMSFFLDSEGNTLALMAEVPHAGEARRGPGGAR